MRPPLSEAGYNAAWFALPIVFLLVFLYNSYKLGRLNKKWITKTFLVLSIIFTTLTFAGAIYVLQFRGRVNAGYAVIPMLISLVCIMGYKICKNRKTE